MYKIDNGKAIGMDGGKLLCRMDDGQFMSIDPPKFRDHQYVQKINKDGKVAESFTQVVCIGWTKNRGWVYMQNYISRDGIGGGSSGGWEEREFQIIESPIDILHAERLRLKSEIGANSISMQNAKAALEKVEFSFRIMGIKLK